MGNRDNFILHMSALIFWLMNKHIQFKFTASLRYSFNGVVRYITIAVLLLSHVGRFFCALKFFFLDLPITFWCAFLTDGEAPFCHLSSVSSKVKAIRNFSPIHL